MEDGSVLDAVRALPENYRNAVYLHYYEGYTAAEVGRMLGAPTNTCLLYTSHRGEQQHVTDRSAVRQQHDQTVNTEAEAARGRQTVLQSVDVVVIDLCLAVGLDGLALGDLTLEAALLVDGVVQLAESLSLIHI